MIKKCSYFIVTASAIALITMAFRGVETTLVHNEFYKVNEPLAYNVPTSKITIKRINGELSDDFSLETNNSFIDFKEALAIRESDGDYEVVNSYGYMGKYQFGKGTLKFIGIKNANDFLKNPALQEKAFIAYLQKNKWILKNDIRKYVGRKVGGVTITESGMLAAAHLGGAGAVQDFLRSNGQSDFVDGYGTNIKTYLKTFANYDLSGIKAAKNPKITS